MELATAAISAAVLALLTYFITKLSLARPGLRVQVIESGIVGIDINKTTQEERATIKRRRWELKEPLPEGKKHRVDEAADKLVGQFVVPESAGIIVGLLHICTVCVGITVVRLVDTGNVVEIHRALAAGFSLLFILLVGFMDDVYDVRWRYKIALSFVATIPLLALYEGPTTTLVPVFVTDIVKPYAPWLVIGPNLLDLKFFYRIFMMLLCVFCTNSVNILAGVNGLEVGQTFVIGVSIAIYNLYSMFWIGGEETSPALMSLMFILPFVGGSAALLRFNWYPARWFVGDSFTYWAGMVLGASSIVGHFSKPLLLFLVPQLINFAISIPQLLGILGKSCPRHRIPKYIPETGKLTATPNETLLNAALWLFGDMYEYELARTLVLFQAGCCACGLAVLINFS